MNILAIETSTEKCSVALQCNQKITQRESDQPRAHARLLLPLIDELMAQAGLRPAQLDAISFARGPGSFTGVRIACAAAQAMGMALDIPLLPVSTLACVAQRGYREHAIKHAAVAMDARMSQVYWASYMVIDGQMTLSGKERVCSPKAVERLNDDFNWHAVGSGWALWRDELAAASGLQQPEVVAIQLPLAGDLLVPAAVLMAAGGGVSADAATPVYLRDNVAQTQAQREMLREKPT